MIRILLNDITSISDVDAIVNSAKNSLLAGGGVDGAIHAKAGGQLTKECRTLGGCKTGEAKITKGYNLLVPYVIHTVGPVHYDEEWSKAHNYDQAGLLSNCYKNSLELAKEYNLTKIAFPAISTGTFDYPIDKATKIALDTVVEFIKTNPDFEVSFVLYNEDIYYEYLKQIKKYNI